MPLAVRHEAKTQFTYLTQPRSKKIGVAKPSMCRLQCTELTKLARMKSHCDTNSSIEAKAHFELPILAVVPAKIT